MLSRNKKKIYIIGVNSSDFFDCTLESIKKINKVDCIVISKFNTRFINILKENGKKLILEEDLSKNKNEELWKKIKNLFKDYGLIAHIKQSDPYLFDEAIDEKKFFEKNGLETEIILGIIEEIDWLNQGGELLTDRKKNSSVIFAKKFNRTKINSMLLNLDFEKLVIRFTEKSDLLTFFGILSNLSNKINLACNIIENGKIKLVTPKIIENFYRKNQLKNSVIIVVEKDEKI